MKDKLPDEILVRCRELRINATNAEKLLWKLLRNRQLAGVKFRRQHALDRFILDFFCHEYQLVIELDGGQHAQPEKKEYDLMRTKALGKHGIRMIRFWNNEVLTNTEGVLQVIWNALTPPSPRGRGGKSPSG